MIEVQVLVDPMLYHTHTSNLPCRIWLEVAKQRAEPTEPGKQSSKEHNDDQKFLDVEMILQLFKAVVRLHLLRSHVALGRSLGNMACRAMLTHLLYFLRVECCFNVRRRNFSVS